MFKVVNTKDSITYKITSQLFLVDRVVSEINTYLIDTGITNSNILRIILRELLINAIEHGNKKMLDKIVSCSITFINDRYFKIAVEDQGEGFDYRKLDLSGEKITVPDQGIKDDNLKQRKRGYLIIKSYSDKIEFNETGNRVTVWITLVDEINFDIKNENNRISIIPSDNLTSSSADKFRKTLVQLYDKGHEQYLINFKNVNDIDSIVLSILFSFGKMLKNRNKKAEPQIINANKDLLALFQMTGLDQFFNIILN